MPKFLEKFNTEEKKHVEGTLGESMLHREGERLELHASMLEIVRPVLELGWALAREGNNSFLNPGHSQV